MEAAVKRCHQTYFDTRKMVVEIAQAIGSANIARPWSKYAYGSSQHRKMYPEQYAHEKKQREEEEELAKNANGKKGKKENKSGATSSNKAMEMYVDAKSNTKSKTWANDLIGEDDEAADVAADSEDEDGDIGARDESSYSDYSDSQYTGSSEYGSGSYSGSSFSTRQNDTCVGQSCRQNGCPSSFATSISSSSSAYVILLFLRRGGIVARLRFQHPEAVPLLPAGRAETRGAA